MPSSHEVGLLLQRPDAGERLVELVTSLGDGLEVSSSIPESAAPEASEVSSLHRDGFAVFEAVADVASSTALTRAIDRLLEATLPAVFVYVFDASWILGERLRASVSAALGHRYALASDGWAWRVDPGARGWGPHRDEKTLFSRTVPERVNVWLALSDATVDRSCIHVVPLDDDPNYPNELTSHHAPPDAVRALPVSAGTALIWNANLLHWGGNCSPHAAPRYAISYTLYSESIAERTTCPLVTPSSWTPLSRIEAVARMISVYRAKRAPDVVDELQQWAEATRALGAFGLRSGRS